MVIAEGILPYFSLRLQQQVFQRVANLLGGCGGGKRPGEGVARRGDEGLAKVIEVDRRGDGQQDADSMTASVQAWEPPSRAGSFGLGLSHEPMIMAAATMRSPSFSRRGERLRTRFFAGSASLNSRSPATKWWTAAGRICRIIRVVKVSKFAGTDKTSTSGKYLSGNSISTPG